VLIGLLAIPYNKIVEVNELRGCRVSQLWLLRVSFIFVVARVQIPAFTTISAMVVAALRCIFEARVTLLRI